jgi:hypothetical protein
VYAEAVRPVEGAEALTSPQSRAGMPVDTGKELGEPKDAVLSPPPREARCGWLEQLGRPAVPQEPGHFRVQEVPRAATRSEAQAGEKARLVQAVPGTL